MQQRGRVQGLEFTSLYAQFLGYLDGIDANPLQMIVRGLVFRLDGQRQRFDGSQVQIRHLFHMPLLVLKLTQI